MRSVWLNRVPYDIALALQEQLVYGKLCDEKHGLKEPEDTLLFLEHDPVFTYQHKNIDFESCLRGKENSFSKFVEKNKIPVLKTTRGGKMTYHGPGQLVGYFIKRLNGPFARNFVERLANAVIKTLAEYGINSHFRNVGVWVTDLPKSEAIGCKSQSRVGRGTDSAKICSIGVRFVRSKISMHGFALNITNEPIPYFEQIHPCDLTDNEHMTSIEDCLGEKFSLEQVSRDIARNMGAVFKDAVHEIAPHALGFYPARKPPWIRAKTPGMEVSETRALVKQAKLHTVCEEARCPNLGECWSRGGDGAVGDVTIMILGDTCTRSCGFCAVKTGRPPVLDLGEPLRTAHAVAKIPHKHIVITSVDRDELADGGAGIWANTLRISKYSSPKKTFEALTPDFKGNDTHIDMVLDARPDVFAHNIETVQRLHMKVRPQAKYDRSLYVLKRARGHRLQPIVKSNIMLGFGESAGEVLNTVRDLSDAGVHILTITQYLQPTSKHLRVIKYYTPSEFLVFKQKAEEIGIPVVVAGPLVRTSYRAGEAYERAKSVMHAQAA